MASKRYKPALFELVNSGPLKPNKRGALNPPRWFYGNKKRLGATQQSTMHGPFTDGHVAKDKDTLAGATSPAEAVSQNVDHEATRAKMASGIFSHQLQVTVSTLVVALVALGLILLLLLTYYMGQRSGLAAANRSDSPSDISAAAGESANEGLADGRNGNIHKKLAPSRPQEPVATKVEQPKQASSISKPTAKPIRRPVGRYRTGQCLWICFHSQKSVLLPVQNYFADNGIATLIGKYDGKYVLCSDHTIESQHSTSAVQLKKQVAKIGASYDSNKPRAALGFDAGTFQGAYWINAGDIKIVNN